VTERGLTLLSTAAGSGKSLLTRSFAVLRRAAGLDVSIYKPLSVTVQPYVDAGRTIDLSMYLSAIATGHASAWEAGICSYFAEAQGPTAVVYDASVPEPAPLLKVPRVSEDGLDFADVDEATWRELVSTCDSAVRGRRGFLVTEGAGGATDLARRDLSNELVAVTAGRPVVLVAGARRGGAVASVIGTWSLLAPECRELMRGFIVNGAENPARMAESVRRAERATGTPCLGVVPLIPLFANSPYRGDGVPVLGDWPEELAHVADFVRQHLSAELLGLLDVA
jgi:AAA domain